jgi:hypothetical protein
MPAKTLEEVFVTEGVPQYTFVKPPNYNDIFLDIRKQGKPVIIEGQSGTGKTTTARKIIEQLSGTISITYLSARDNNDVEKIYRLVDRPLEGYFMIDDFHRLSKSLQEGVGNLAKYAAEQGEGSKLPKLIIIGINQIGSGLINLVPDIAKRCGIHNVASGSPEAIFSLIETGCEELNIIIENYKSIFHESKGDYWLTQLLCQQICADGDVLNTQENRRTISFDLNALRAKVIKRLEATYYPPVKDFCRGKRFRKSNDPYFKLLRLIGQQDSSIVDLTKLANQNEDLKGSINNIKERRLEILLSDKESLNKYFYYDGDTKNFAIDDPALFYFIKHLNWDKVRDDCGFSESDKNYEFDIAISFAGENRDLARTIAAKFESLDVHVFFDELYEPNLLGKALHKQFTKIFNEESRFVICLLDKYHMDKVWPTFERDTFLPRVAEESVIPIWLDDTKFPGIPADTYGVNLKGEITEEKIDSALFKVIDRIG